MLVGALARFGPDERRFLQSYLTAGLHIRELIGRLTALRSHMLAYLVSEAELDDEARLSFVSACLAQLSDRPRQREISTPSPGPDEPPHGPGENEVRQPAER